MVHEDDRDIIRRSVNRATEAGIDFDVEHRTVWQDGAIRCMESKGRVFRDSDGKSVRLMGTVIDITERKQAEQMERIVRELRLAAEIQQEFLPGGAPRIEGFELGGHSYPSGQIGGDFYDFLSLTAGSVLQRVMWGEGYSRCTPDRKCTMGVARSGRARRPDIGRHQSFE